MVFSVISFLFSDKKVFLFPLIIELIYFCALFLLNYVPWPKEVLGLTGIFIILGFIFGLLVMMISSFFIIRRLFRTHKFEFIPAFFISISEALLVAVFFWVFSSLVVIFIVWFSMATGTAQTTTPNLYFYSEGFMLSSITIMSFGAIGAVCIFIFLLRALVCFILSFFVKSTYQKDASFSADSGNLGTDFSLSTDAQKGAGLFFGVLFFVSVALFLCVGFVSIVLFAGSASEEYADSKSDKLSVSPSVVFNVDNTALYAYSGDKDIAEISFFISPKGNKTIKLFRESFKVEKNGIECGYYLYRFTDKFGSQKTRIGTEYTYGSDINVSPLEYRKIHLVVFGTNCGLVEKEDANYFVTYTSSDFVSPRETISFSGKFSYVESISKNFYYLKSKAQSFLAKGDFDSAYSYYLQAYALSKPADFTDHIGILYDVDKNAFRVIDFYQKYYLKDYPKSAFAYNEVCLAYLDLNLYSEAIQNCLSAVEIEPKNKTGLINIGFAYSSMDAKDKAIEYYLKAYSVDAEYPLVLANLALAYKSVGNCEEARKYYSELIIFSPNYVLSSGVPINEYLSSFPNPC